MAITEVAYCTREDVQRALNIADTPRLNEVVDRAVMAGARNLEGALHRKFYPETKTVLFDMPDDEFLWLYENELAAAPTEILSGGTPMTVNTDVLLRPKSGPPYGWLEAKFSGSVYWQADDTTQQAVSITSDAWNHPVTRKFAFGLDGSIDDSTELLVLDDSSVAGVGSLIILGDERILVEDKTMSATGATLAADLTDAKSAITVTVSDGTLIYPGEVLMIDSERVYVQYVIGDTLTVERAVNASTLTAHTSGAVIAAPRTASVSRGVLGTDAVSHAGGANAYLLQAPSLIRQYNLALAVTDVTQATSAYVRPVGSGNNQREQAGLGVDKIAAYALTAYGRQCRGRAI